MRIAVIGGGVSGLTAAYRLATAHEVTLFEAQDYLGGHAQTLDVEYDGESHTIDTGFMVFNDWTYPRFCELLQELQVESRPTEMSFSVRSDIDDLEYQGSSLNGLFAQRRNLRRPRFYRFLADILRFNRQAPRDVLRQPATWTQTVGEYLRRNQYSREFAEHYLLPMGAAIWSCPLGTFADFPIRFIVEFYQNHGLLHLWRRPTWRVIAGGSRIYVSRLAKRFSQGVRLRAPIREILRQPDRVVVSPVHGDAVTFDHVILACHADQALRMLADATPVEQEVLSAFPYEPNVALVHVDPAPLPRQRRAWASWNYRISQGGTAGLQDRRPASVTYLLNRLQHLESRHPICVTLNGEEQVDPTKVLRRLEYAHPVFTTRRAAAQARHVELINTRRTSFCGAYWGNGFHEDGVVSALRVSEALLPQAVAM